MKKFLLLKISLIMTLGLIFDACSKEDHGQTNNEPTYAHFVQEQLTVSAPAGETTALLEWTYTNWEIVIDDNKGIITNISITKGGDPALAKQYTQVTFSYSENTTSESRTQDIFLIDKKTGERSKLVFVQNSLYATQTITLYPTVKYQPVVGFGGMYFVKTWLAADKAITEAEMNKMFDPNQLGYNMLRLMIYPNESDWAADVQGAKLAQQQGAILLASPWNCPDALAETITANGKSVKHVKPASYQAYTDHLVKYVNYMKSNGVNIYTVSVQNEPDAEFTFWYPQEVVDYIKNYGDQIRATGVKLMAPEAIGMSPEYTDPVLNDAVAFGKTDIVSGHLYQGFVKTGESSYVKNRHDYICGLYNSKLAGVGKTWWMTEHLFNDGETETNPALWQFQKWSYNLENLAQEIHMSMEGYCSAYVYWYLKRFYGMIGDNDQRSLVAQGEVSKNGYILSHYAKYASNTVRIKIETGDTEVKATAYINNQGTEITVVFLNMKTQAFNARINSPVALKSASAVETTENKNMAAVETVISSDQQSATVFLSAKGIASVRLILK
jgi:glucuronoarabinoxylan endo-1,4-beta-xylanase